MRAVDSGDGNSIVKDSNNRGNLRISPLQIPLEKRDTCIPNSLSYPKDLVQ